MKHTAGLLALPLALAAQLPTNQRFHEHSGNLSDGIPPPSSEQAERIVGINIKNARVMIDASKLQRGIHSFLVLTVMIFGIEAAKNRALINTEVYQQATTFPQTLWKRFYLILRNDAGHSALQHDTFTTAGARLKSRFYDSNIGHAFYSRYNNLSVI